MSIIDTITNEVTVHNTFASLLNAVKNGYSISLNPKNDDQYTLGLELLTHFPPKSKVVFWK